MTVGGEDEFDVPTWWRQSAFLEFKQHYIKKKTPLFFIGSGLSIGAGLPTWRELLLKLAQIHDDQAPASRAILPVITPRVSKTTVDQTQYLLAGTDIQNAFRSDVGADACRNAINSLLNDETRLAKTSPAHEIIATLRWSRIITTNYDVLIERAARAGGKRYKVKTTHPEHDDFREAEPAEAHRRLVLKIHGDIADSKSSLILSAESFERRYRGADEEKYTTVLKTVLRSSSVILFLGYGHNDQYIRLLFKNVLNYAAVRQNVFALVPREGDPDQFAAHVTELSDQQIQVITYSPDSAHRELTQFLKYFTDPSGHEARYERNIRSRRPTVIMLHCGGTIGSAPAQASDAHDHLQVVVKHSRYDSGLNEFSERLMRWYNASFNSGETMRIDICWEILPPADQMFSENATYALWNALTNKLAEIIYKYFHAGVDPDGMMTDPRLLDLYKSERSQYERAGHKDELTEHAFRDDFSRRYILGIIVLFGTDTLTFATGALGVSLQHLPCPIVITGANQPPREENLAARRGQFYSTSDAWTNLMNAIYFLQCFGHRLTEMFVCFGNTVHNAVNLRKRGAEIIPAGLGWRTRRHSEPFAFRNLSLRGQYMFKLIDGLFCNNYYPNPIQYQLMVQEKEFSDMRHIRFDGVSLEPPKPTVSEPFLPRITYVDVSPCFPLIDLAKMVERGLFAVLVQGYPSGTYPSEQIHEFAHFLESAHALGVPIVLVSGYGILPSQQEYDVANPVADHATVLPLYDIIVEGALPLVCLVASRIAVEEWQQRKGEDIDKALARRKELLRQGIADLFAERPNILSLELKSVGSKGDMQAEMVVMQELRLRQREQRETHDAEVVRRMGGTGDLPGPPSDEARNVVVLARREFLLLLDELPNLFERVEAAPDGLDGVFNLAFDQGVRLWRSCQAARPSKPQAEDDLATDGSDLFFGLQEPKIREQRVKDAEAILATVCDSLSDSGIATLEFEPLKIADRLTSEAMHTARAGSFTLPCRIERPQSSAHIDERYAVMSFSEDERQFFARLSRGGEGDDVAQYDRDLKRRYAALLHKTWTHSTTTVDWLLLGLLKGVAYGVATFLRIDLVASSAEVDARFRQWFRKMMKTNIRVAEKQVWHVSYKYSELQPSDYEVMREVDVGR